jgi:hypothetical protein
MKKQVIAIVAAIGISFAAASPAKAWYPGGWGGYGGYGYGGYGYGGWGYGGGYGAALGIGAGAALLGGVIGGAIAAQSYAPYGYGYAPAYGYAPQRPIRKNVIIKNSPGATVIEDDDFGW